MPRVMCVWCPLWPVQRLRSQRLAQPLGLRDERAAPLSPPAPQHLQYPQHPQHPPISSLPQRASDPPTPNPSNDARENPVVFFSEGRRGFEVVVCSPEAMDWGIRVGMPLGEVRSLLPIPARVTPGAKGRTGLKRLRRPILKRFDPVGDRLRLQAIAVDCIAYSPLVGLDEGASPESIWLDISGSEALFGGEQGLAGHLQNALAKQGVHVRVAIADSWGAAWAVSHFGKSEISLVPSGQQESWLATLPLAALRIPDSIRRVLQTLDIVTIGQLMRLPRASLPSRFGKELIRRLDQATGVAPELLTPERPVEPIFAEWLFEEPVADRQTLDHVCELLFERLLTMLDERRAGLRELACHWLGTSTEPTSLRLLRPTTDRRHLFGLLRLQCERRGFARGVHGVRMEVVEMGLSVVRQATLFADDPSDKNPQALAELVDRLSLRLGRQAVLRPRLTHDSQPEFACETLPWLDARASNVTETIISISQLRCRPFRLLETPQPLRFQAISAAGLPSRINQSPVVSVSGPERIETGWWRGPDVKRDYYRFDLASGSRLWGFVDRDTGLWFLHGIFA